VEVDLDASSKIDRQVLARLLTQFPSITLLTRFTFLTYYSFFRFYWLRTGYSLHNFSFLKIDLNCLPFPGAGCALAGHLQARGVLPDRRAAAL
jgi:hypothetical protein